MQRKIFFFCWLGIVILLSGACSKAPRPKYVLALHGGAGNIPLEMPDSIKKEYIRSIDTALKVGEEILKSGGSSVDAVVATIKILEDNPLFNAGKGSVYTYEGKISLDASLMDGSNLMAGAVAGVPDVKNPILLSHHIMLHSENVLLSGDGASAYARQNGIETADSSYFFTPQRWDDHLEGLKNEIFGTVGCVALDLKGNLAAGTSTGGRTNKRWGRIGDTPIIGAGTYANNKTCAISCTGHGEYFMRHVVAHEISNMTEYKGWTIKQAANFMIQEVLKKSGGDGGLIAVDRNGNIAMSFNTTGMFRGYIKANGEKQISIFTQPELFLDKSKN